MNLAQFTKTVQGWLGEYTQALDPSQASPPTEEEITAFFQNKISTLSLDLNEQKIKARISNAKFYFVGAVSIKIQEIFKNSISTAGSAS